MTDSTNEYPPPAVASVDTASSDSATSDSATSEIPETAPGADTPETAGGETNAGETNAAETNAAETDAPEADAGRDPAPFAETVSVETVRVRRTPRYARFALVGALVCIAAAFILTYSFPQGPGYDRNSVFGFMLLVAVTVGVALGCVAALIAERVTSVRARTVAVDRIGVTAIAATDADELELASTPEPGHTPEPATGSTASESRTTESGTHT